MVNKHGGGLFVRIRDKASGQHRVMRVVKAVVIATRSELNVLMQVNPGDGSRKPMKVGGALEGLSWDGIAAWCALH